MGLIKKDIVQVDRETGEVQEGVMVLVPTKNRLKDRFTMLTGQALIMLAADQDLKWEDWRVLAVYLGSMDFENLIKICQKNVADILGMRKEHVSRSTRKLLSKNILIEDAKDGRSKTYRLNTVYGWKGKITKAYVELYERDSKLVA
jgi:DNA-binding transcriptional ArsR family regulator